ncbi:MAG TPA: Na+/H+ antiporter [Gemmatimonadales bacterium]|nr:Na+/H+ antiporter [Gemmatimonadales bacterium]
MVVFELVIALLVVGAILAAWARRVNLPYPALLALAGAALALLPNAPTVTLDPELALALFVAPVLLDAAFDSSPRDLKENWRAVTGLALVAVGLTVAAVAFVVRWLVPEMPWPAAIALGAIVAPPDAAAATAVLRQLRPPHRVLVILEGESLFNDASALLIYRLAVAAAATGTFSGWSAVPTFLVVSAGSILLGAVLSRITMATLPRIQDVATAVIAQFVTTFGVWLLAERLGLSGIITMVVYAILIARTAPDQIPARIRIPSYAVWEVTVFVLNVLAFILVGLQLKPILQRLSGGELVTYFATGSAVIATVIVVRFGWVMGYVAAGRLRAHAGGPGKPAWCPSYSAATIIAWCGMRGIVTLAAALALPDGASPFPYRDLILFTAFAVVLGTLVLQGLTLRPLMRSLQLEADDSVEREVHLARVETARAALDAVDGAASEDDMVRLLRRKFEARAAATERNASGGARGDGNAGYAAALRRAQVAQRRTLSELRARGVIGDDAFHRVEEELDWAEVNADAMDRSD